MITCIARVGKDGCAWWWDNKCNHNSVKPEIKMVCKGQLPRLEKEK